MNLNEIQNLWNSAGNRPPTAIQQQWADKFTRQMIRRRRFQSAWLINTFLWLTLVTVLAGWNVMKKKVALDQEWALFPLLIVPWAFAFHFLRRYLKPAAPIARGEISVAESLRAALNSNKAEQSHLKLVGVLFAIMIPVLAVSLWQLRATHKVLAHELMSMVILFGGVLLVSSAGIAARYFGRVLPQQRQINALLAELNEQPQG
jgi:hypothetical protein